MKYHDPESIADIIKRWREEDPLINEQILACEAVRVFGKLTEKFSREIKSCRVTDGVLYVEVYSSVVREELRLHAAELTEEVNSAVAYNIITGIKVF